MARTVLLADDSVTAQNMGRRILTDAGYEVITVNNGSAALKKIHESKPDLIVLDVYMPGYGGLEVCQRLKESEATMRIPVLLTVGKMEPFKTDEAKRVRADGHIVKPFDASELLAALTRLEDRIVPQSEAGRANSAKSEAKKSRRLRGEEITADEGDDSRQDRISYLEEVKRRHATPLKEDSAEPAKADSLTGIERQARMSSQENEDAVTFAAGPIFEPRPSSAAEPQNFAPEFPVEKEADSEQLKSETSTTEEQEETRPEPSVSGQDEISEAAANSKRADAEPPAVEADAAAKVESTPRWVAENVALTAEEASRSLDDEMRQAQSASEPIAEAEKKQDAVEVTPVTMNDDEGKSTQSSPETEPSGAAFAAAASASGASNQTEAVSNVAPEAPQGALDNWERVRDTEVGKQVAEAIAQTVAALTENNAPSQSEKTGQTVSDAASHVPAEQTAEQRPASGDPLSSIVDNVLAELKPRLLAEIAKQLANDKK
ncbi:MAG TPA: response regulator [Terriglobales bacterium]|nr:response regulator [Terriglobales bacterium]